MNYTHRRQLFWNSLVIVLGNALYALTVALFLEPAGLVTGGATGIALAFGRLTGLSVSGFLLVFNLAMLVWGWSSGPVPPPAAWISRRWCSRNGSACRCLSR